MTQNHGNHMNTTTEQRATALQEANRIRTWRAHHKHQLKTMPRPTAYTLAAQHITNPPPELHTITTNNYLLSIPATGKSKAQQHLEAAGVTPTKRLAELTPDEAARLAGVIEDRAVALASVYTIRQEAR